MIKVHRAAALVASALVAASVLLGCDSVLLAVAVVVTPRALCGRRLDQHLFAFWLLLFAVLAPCYHPYLRLILPAYPAVVLLVVEPLLELLSRSKPVQPHDGTGPGVLLQPARIMVLLLFLACWYAVAQPFGWLPDAGLWLRWKSVEGYQAFAQWVRENTPERAAFLCQGQPPFAIYCPRQAVLLGNESFAAATEGLPDDRPTYLAVDFRIVHEPQSLSKREMRQYADALEPVHTLRLDLNLVTLLDYLTPWELARKVRSDSEAIDYLQIDNGHRLPLPAPVSLPGWDTIYIYRIDLARLRAQTAKPDAGER